jgi:hypothetical protein
VLRRNCRPASRALHTLSRCLTVSFQLRPLLSSTQSAVQYLEPPNCTRQKKRKAWYGPMAQLPCQLEVREIKPQKRSASTVAIYNAEASGASLVHPALLLYIARRIKRLLQVRIRSIRHILHLVQILSMELSRPVQSLYLQKGPFRTTVSGCRGVQYRNHMREFVKWPDPAHRFWRLARHSTSNLTLVI